MAVIGNTPEELTLFDTAHDTPGCQYPGERCGKSSTYTNLACRGESCLAAHREYKRDYKNRIRTGAQPGRRPAQAIQCKTCGKEFIKNQGEAGTKYCSNDCKQYPLTLPRSSQKTTHKCQRCNADYQRDRRGRQTYLKLCPTCVLHPVYLAMSSAFKRHRVPLDIVLDTIEWPYCANEQCGDWLLQPRINRRANGHYRPGLNFTIDHDHGCCPEVSCGRCIRGVLCRACNHSLTESVDTPKLHGLVDYLENATIRT